MDYTITADQIRELRYAADILVDFGRADRRPRIEAADTIKFITDQVLRGGAGVAPEMPVDPRPNLASEPASPANPGPIAPVVPAHAHEPASTSAPMSAPTLPKRGDGGDDGVEGRGAVRIVEPAPVQVVAEAVTAVEEPARERGAGGVERERRGGVRAGR